MLRAGHEGEVAGVGASLASSFGVFHRLLANRLRGGCPARPRRAWPRWPPSCRYEGLGSRILEVPDARAAPGRAGRRAVGGVLECRVYEAFIASALRLSALADERQVAPAGP